jgi:hypothetical protein
VYSAKIVGRLRLKSKLIFGLYKKQRLFSRTYYSTEPKSKSDFNLKMNYSVSENERFIEQRLANPKQAEARAWLDGHNDEYFINFGESGSNEESRELVDKFYDYGAVAVIAVEIDKYEGAGKNTGKLVIVIPENKEQRAKILDLCNDIAEEQGFDRLEDFGQRRVFLMLD